MPALDDLDDFCRRLAARARCSTDGKQLAVDLPAPAAAQGRDQVAEGHACRLFVGRVDVVGQSVAIAAPLAVLLILSLFYQMAGSGVRLL